ncbi:MAG: peroxiredoxin [Actinobacteria bacterium]|nr:peroxiredoxin [Actinomycetota bacterium]
MSKGPQVGDPAPDFTLPGVQGHDRRGYTLSDYRGQKVLLAFYPGDFTLGCTRQMCTYRDNFDEFTDVDATVFGISPQDVDSHERWIEKQGFQFPLLADTDRKVAEAYGIAAPVIGVRRSIFAIDTAGLVQYRCTGTVRAIFKPPKAIAEILDRAP